MYIIHIYIYIHTHTIITHTHTHTHTYTHTHTHTHTSIYWGRRDQEHYGTAGMTSSPLPPSVVHVTSLTQLDLMISVGVREAEGTPHEQALWQCVEAMATILLDGYKAQLKSLE